MVLAFLTGGIVPGFLWKQERKRAEDAEQRERDLRAKWEDKALPLLSEASRAVTEAMATLRVRRDM